MPNSSVGSYYRSSRYEYINPFVEFMDVDSAFERRSPAKLYTTQQYFEGKHCSVGAFVVPALEAIELLYCCARLSFAVVAGAKYVLRVESDYFPLKYLWTQIRVKRHDDQGHAISLNPNVMRTTTQEKQRSRNENDTSYLSSIV